MLCTSPSEVARIFGWSTVQLVLERYSRGPIDQIYEKFDGLADRDAIAPRAVRRLVLDTARALAALASDCEQMPTGNVVPVLWTAIMNALDQLSQIEDGRLRPSEAVMLFAGFTVSNNDQTLLGITLAGLAGNMAGSWLTYAIGYYGRIDLLEKNRLIHFSPSRLAWVDSWFKRHGDATVFFARLLPLVRAFISLPAGVAKMPFWRFTWMTALGSLPWVLGFALVGQAVGDNWERWRNHLQVLDYLVVAGIVGLIVYALVRRRRGGGSDEGEAAEPASAGGA